MRTQKEIKQYLTEFAKALQSRGVRGPLHIVLVGGAFMIIRKMRSFTEDLDFATIVPNPSGGATVVHDETSRTRSTIPFAREIRGAIEEIATRHNLPEDWLNDQAAEYLYDDAPHPDVELWQVFNKMLYVYLPSFGYILATKIAAARPKDINDIKALMKVLGIKNRQQMQTIVDQYLLPEAQDFWEVQEKMDDLFS